MRSVTYKYLEADNKRLVHRIAHLQHILQQLVAKNHSDPAILDELNIAKKQLATNKQQLLHEYNQRNNICGN